MSSLSERGTPLLCLRSPAFFMGLRLLDLGGCSGMTRACTRWPLPTGPQRLGSGWHHHKHCLHFRDWRPWWSHWPGAGIQLGLFDCTGITDAWAGHTAGPQWACSTRTWALAHWITDAGLHSEAAIALRVDLSGCSEITDARLHSLGLKLVDLAMCTE